MTLQEQLVTFLSFFYFLNDTLSIIVSVACISHNHYIIRSKWNGFPKLMMIEVTIFISHSDRVSLVKHSLLELQRTVRNFVVKLEVTILSWINISLYEIT